MPRKFTYSVHPGVFMVQKWASELPQKTGRSLEQWVSVVKMSPHAANKDRIAWLKKRHKLGTRSAGWIVERAAAGLSWAAGDAKAYLRDAERYVEDMFSGPKAALRPLYNQLLALAFQVGKDVKASPATTIVPLYRNHVFAQIKPTTNTRIDLGLALGDTNTPKRLLSTGGLEKGDRITHRIPVSSAKDIDTELRHWLAIAYELDA